MWYGVIVGRDAKDTAAFIGNGERGVESFA